MGLGSGLGLGLGLGWGLGLGLGLGGAGIAKRRTLVYADAHADDALVGHTPDGTEVHLAPITTSVPHPHNSQIRD